MALSIIESAHTECTFVLDGYQIPYITGHLTDDPNTWQLSIDHRLAIGVPADQLSDVLWFVAQAMAVSAGYSAHGEYCVSLNPHQRKVNTIQAVQHRSDGQLAAELFGVDNASSIEGDDLA